MQASTELLQLIRFQVSIYHNAKVCGNWQLAAHAPGHTCFHLVTQGRCLVEIPGHVSTSLADGDLLLFPRELPHQLTPLEALQGAIQHLPYDEAAHIPGTGLLCAQVNFRHPAAEQVLDALPPVLVIRRTATSWLQPLTAMIMRESRGDRVIASALLERLCELLFVYALAHITNDSPIESGLLALYAHPRLSRALNAMHGEPERDWSLDGLAREAAMSRSKFAKLFREIGGWTPMQYLTWWRLQVAHEHLSAGESINNTASLVGYRSQAAFSRAYTQCFGVNPGATRQQGSH